MKSRDMSCGFLGEAYSMQKGQQVQRPYSKKSWAKMSKSRWSVWMEWHEQEPREEMTGQGGDDRAGRRDHHLLDFVVL